MKSCKELVFHRNNDGREIFTAVVFCIDARTLQVYPTNLIEIICEDEEDLINTLAAAEIHEVPVVPNEHSLNDRILELSGKLHSTGFTAPQGDERIRLKLTRSPGQGFFSRDLIEWIPQSDFHQRSTVLQAARIAKAELAKYEYAEKILSSINAALSELRNLLNATHSEQDLHRCIQDNPVLFGVEYRNIVSKHDLGTEYQTDFVLQRLSGTIDVVEIESDRAQVFTKAGNPSSQLTHAEQQVFDWLAWIEDHASYERRNFPSLITPVGWVIIGRTKDLDDKGVRKLNQRNRIFWGRLQILTYDDLVAKAENLIRSLANNLFAGV